MAVKFKIELEGLLLTLSSKMPAISVEKIFAAVRLNSPESTVIAPDNAATVLSVSVPDPASVRLPVPLTSPEMVSEALGSYPVTSVSLTRSTGAVIELVAENVPAGLGAPVYGKLDSDLAAALMSINAVKGVEIGDGFAAATLSGEDNADEMFMANGKLHFYSNHAGGILGGISSGQPIVARFAVKPTSSILTPRRTVDTHGENTEIVTKGRHDPCVGIRAVPVGEAMMACVLADHLLRDRGQIVR